MKFSGGRLCVILLAPFIAAAFVTVALMLIAIIATEMATTLDIPSLVTYTGTKDSGGGGRTLLIDGSWTAAAVVTGILTSLFIALALFLPD